MSRKGLIWTLVVAVIVACVAIGIGVTYRSKGPDGTEVATAPVTPAAPKVPAAAQAPATPASEDAKSEKAKTEAPAVTADTATEAQENTPEDVTAAEAAAAAKDNAAGIPTFDAVGVEPDGQTVVAGRATPNSEVDLLANGTVVGKTKSNNVGEWTIIPDAPLKPGNYDLSLQSLKTGGGTPVLSHQHVAVAIPEGGKERPLVVLNEPDQPSSVLQEPAPAEIASASPETSETSEASSEEASSEPTSAPTGEGAGTPTVEASGSAAGTEGNEAVQAKPTVTVEAVETENGEIYVAGTASPKSHIRVYVSDDPLGETKANNGGRWLVEGKKTVPSAGDVEIRADQLDEDGKTVVARAAVLFHREQEAVVLARVEASGGGSAGGEGSEQKELPAVIIHKGDNLWNISRRLYGTGFRYTTIYLANKSQIRNPDLIYPGQVFLTPEGDDRWKDDGVKAETNK